MGRAFQAVRRGIHRENLRFRPRSVVVVGAWKDFRTGGWTVSSAGGADFLYQPQAIGKQPITLGFHTVVEVSAKGNTVFFPGLPEFQIYRGIC